MQKVVEKVQLMEKKTEKEKLKEKEKEDMSGIKQAIVAVCG